MADTCNLHASSEISEKIKNCYNDMDKRGDEDFVFRKAYAAAVNDLRSEKFVPWF